MNNWPLFEPGNWFCVLERFWTHPDQDERRGSYINAGDRFMIVSRQNDNHHIPNSNGLAYGTTQFKCISADGTMWFRTWRADKCFTADYSPKHVVTQIKTEP